METSGADLVFCKLVKYYANGKTQLLPDSISEGFLNPVENLFGIGTQSLLGQHRIIPPPQKKTSSAQNKAKDVP